MIIKKILLKEFDGIHIDSDFIYEVFWICLGSVMTKVRTYYSDSWEGELIFLRDKRMDEYFQLIVQYCRITSMKENENPHFKDVMEAIDMSMNYQDNMYDCDFRYNEKTLKGCRIVLALYGEFSNYYEIVEGMIGLIEFFEEKAKKLRQEIENLKGLEVAT